LHSTSLSCDLNVPPPRRHSGGNIFKRCAKKRDRIRIEFHTRSNWQKRLCAILASGPIEASLSLLSAVGA
jgi:hypothetical protein